MCLETLHSDTHRQKLRRSYLYYYDLEYKKANDFDVTTFQQPRLYMFIFNHGIIFSKHILKVTDLDDVNLSHFLVRSNLACLRVALVPTVWQFMSVTVKTLCTAGSEDYTGRNRQLQNHKWRTHARRLEISWSPVLFLRLYYLT